MKTLPNFRTNNRLLLSGKGIIKPVSILIPPEVGEWLAEEIPAGQRSGFAWRAMALMLGLLGEQEFAKCPADIKPDPQDRASAYLISIMNEKQLKAFGTALCEMSRYFFQEFYDRTGDSAGIS